MSIVIGDVTLTDLPSNALETYPYYIICQLIYGSSGNAGNDSYFAMLSATPFVYLPKDIILDNANDSMYDEFNGAVMNDGTDGKVYQTTNNLGTWVLNGNSSDGYVPAIYDGTISMQGVKIGYNILYTSHTIYVASAANTDSKPYTYTLTDNYYVPGKGVQIGYDISSFPPAPDEYISTYPFATICHVLYNGTELDALLLTKEQLILATMSSETYLTCLSTSSYVAYILNPSSNEWGFIAIYDNQVFHPYDSNVLIIGANYTLMNFNLSTQSVTIVLNRNIYPNTNFAYMPTELSNTYPYSLLARIDIATPIAIDDSGIGSSPDTSFIYLYLMSQEPIIYVDIPTYSGKLNGLISQSMGSAIYMSNVQFVDSSGNLLWDGSEENGGISVALEFDNSMLSLIKIIFTPLWSNHDIANVVDEDENGNLVYSDLWHVADEQISPPDKYSVGRLDILRAAQQARRHNGFSTEPLSLEEMSFILNDVAILDDAEEVEF